MKHIKFLIAVGCLTIIAVFAGGVVSADIAIAPLTRTIQVVPGKTESVIYKLANQGEEAVSIEINARTWFSLPENAGLGIEQWLKPEADKLTLAPNQERELKFKVSVPKTAKGELAGMIYFTPERQTDQTIGTSYGVSLYVFVKGTEIVKPEIGEVSINKREDKFYLTVTIENKGNVHFRPKVNAAVKTGEDFKEDVILPFGKPIFGGQSHIFVEELKGKLPEEGSCVIDVFCNYGNSPDTIIKKTVSLDLTEVKKEE